MKRTGFQRLLALVFVVLPLSGPGKNPGKLEPYYRMVLQSQALSSLGDGLIVPTHFREGTPQEEV